MAVMGLLMPVAGLIKVRYRGAKADIDSPFFKLHYRTSATFCFISCLLVTANDLIGSTIDCISGTIPGNVLNTYCWIMSTFSVPSKPGGVHGEDYAYQGVEPLGDPNDRVIHAYYQWVPFVLFFQGLLFYFPHWLWKTFEDRKLDKITSGLRGRTLSLDERKDQCSILVKYVTETFHMHNFYAFKYFICDILNFINVIVQIYMINAFLGGVFMAYGSDVLYWSESASETRTDPMIDVFPRITKCNFYKYGPSGTIERHDAMCVLALNIINEKIYVFLWFWYIILAVMTSLYLLYVLAVVAVPSMRRVMVERNAKFDIKEKMDILMRKAQMGDWFVIFLLSKNLDSILFKEFIVQLADKLKTDA
ncbi:innexin inx3-like isoform X2 [Tigriopus californicus]|uniref:innexin inx3-like isoform X2 n=1 Tax=Tigriopus californicus TaxID=6832 RepID=UPI0027DA2DC8|nr:innexin inx3-like isoform X2 [Tigriopus californicus]